MSRNESIDIGLSRRRVVGAMAGIGIVQTTGGATDGEYSQTTDERLQLSVREEDGTLGNRITVDLNVRDELLDAVNQWIVDFGTDDTRSAQELADLLDSYDDRPPGAVYGELQYVYDRNGQYTIELRAEQENAPDLVATAGPIVVGTSGDDDLVHVESWETDFTGPFIDRAHQESWETEFIEPFDREIHQESWETDFVSGFDREIHQEGWETDFTGPFDRRIHRDIWDEALDGQTIQVSAVEVSTNDGSGPTTLDVTAAVANVSDEGGTQQIALGIDEESAFEPGNFDYRREVSREITLEPHESRSITFEGVSTDGLDPGEYHCGVVTPSDVMTTPVSIEGEEPSVADYADENGIVQYSGLQRAVDDWRAGRIDTDLLNDVLDAWRSGEPVT